MKQQPLILTGLLLLSLTACTEITPSYHSVYYSEPFYQEPIYDLDSSVMAKKPAPKAVVVRPGYYLQAGANPVKHDSSDMTWIANQANSSYTIEIGDDEKPAAVAKKLFVSPKKERGAQFKYQENGQTRYQGVYGSYPNQEAAEKALASLPEDVKSGAKIKNWSEVKSKAATSPSSSVPEVEMNHSAEKPVTTQE